MQRKIMKLLSCGHHLTNENEKTGNQVQGLHLIGRLNNL